MIPDHAAVNQHGAAEILEDVAIEQKVKIPTGVAALDAALSGGVVHGFSILLSGAPGAGKSTIAQEFCATWTNALNTEEWALFATSEEDKGDVAERAARCEFDHRRRTCVMADNSGEAIFKELERKDRPYRLLVLDSVQTTAFRGHALLSTQGAIELVSAAHSWAKKNMAIAIVLCQENADGHAYGPQALSHIVDCVLSLEVFERSLELRYLSTLKNRKGRAPLEHLVRMTDRGLVLASPDQLGPNGKPVRFLGELES